MIVKGLKALKKSLQKCLVSVNKLEVDPNNTEEIQKLDDAIEDMLEKYENCVDF